MKRFWTASFGILPVVALMAFLPAKEPAPASSPALGSITGKITYDGSVPKLRPYDMNADPACAALHEGGKAPSQTLVLGSGNTMANIFVQIKNPPAGNHPTPRKAAVMNLKGCLASPRVMGVMAGQTVKFKNSDGILHNVHGLPKVNREFNIGMPPTLKESDHTFNKPEPLFKVKCDVHPWMNSYIAVMTHPYFAVTGTDGTFKIDNLPDGTYEIEAWHERLPAMAQTVTIQNGTGNVNFSFKPPSSR